MSGDPKGSRAPTVGAHPQCRSDIEPSRGHFFVPATNCGSDHNTIAAASPRARANEHRPAAPTDECCLAGHRRVSAGWPTQQE